MDTQEVIEQLDPTHVLADPTENAARYAAANDVNLQEMKDSILAQGGIMQPVEVVALTEKVKGGFTHRLIYGFRRHAAILALNKEQNAGLMLPAIVRDLDPASIMARQIAENNDRKNLTPMDKASAIKRLLNAGTSRAEVRRIFASMGGKKGTELVPMSNAAVNMYVNFLDLPKPIQQKIHDGLINVSAAYTLCRVSPEKRADVLEKAEGERLKLLKAEIADEEKFLAAEQRVEEAKKEAADAATDVEKAKAEVEAAEALAKEKVAAYVKIGNEIKASETSATKEDVERLKAAEADKKGADKTLKEAKARFEKATKDASETSEKAKAKAEQLEAARKLKAKAKKPSTKGTALTEKDIKKADPTTGAINLNVAEFRQALKDMQKDGVPAKVGQIAAIFQRVINGELTPKMAVEDLVKLLGGAKK
jgi:ParB/RepB/Spo0J family partition protein